MTTPLKKMRSSLLLESIELDVYIGYIEAERKQKQKIRLDVELHFLHPPRACSTDDLNDTHCYDTLIKNIHLHLDQRQFHLIEHLAKELYQFIKQQFAKQEMTLNVCITKNPIDYIPSLLGGVSFCYGDA